MKKHVMPITKLHLFRNKVMIASDGKNKTLVLKALKVGEIEFNFLTFSG